MTTTSSQPLDPRFWADAASDVYPCNCMLKFIARGDDPDNYHTIRWCPSISRGCTFAEFLAQHGWTVAELDAAKPTLVRLAILGDTKVSNLDVSMVDGESIVITGTVSSWADKKRARDSAAWIVSRGAIVDQLKVVRATGDDTRPSTLAVASYRRWRVAGTV